MTVYREMERDATFAERIEECRARSIEVVENTLFQCAQNPASTVDRIFYLKTNRPDKYAERLNPRQVEEIREAARKATIGELQLEIGRLPKGAREIVMAALERSQQQLAP